MAAVCVIFDFGGWRACRGQSSAVGLHFDVSWPTTGNSRSSGAGRLVVDGYFFLFRAFFHRRHFVFTLCIFFRAFRISAASALPSRFVECRSTLNRFYFSICYFTRARTIVFLCSFRIYFEFYFGCVIMKMIFKNKSLKLNRMILSANSKIARLPMYYLRR